MKIYKLEKRTTHDVAFFVVCVAVAVAVVFDELVYVSVDVAVFYVLADAF